MKRLEAMSNALNAILAGVEGEGDAGDIPFSDYEAAETWVREQMRKRAALATLKDTSHAG
jgi:hypothetical protein